MQPKMPSSHLNFSSGTYLESTTRPLYALLFLLPLIGFYEIGTLLVHTDHIAHTQARIATFTWLAGLAEWIGVDQTIAWLFPGLAVVLILLCWHLSSLYSWKVRPGWLGWMALESIVLSLPLFILGALINTTAWPAAAVRERMLGGGVNGGGFLANIVTSAGAGIYEELVFRLILIGLLGLLFEDLFRLKGSMVHVLVGVISAVLFSLHHYTYYQDGGIVSLESFHLASFLFRTAAGLYLAFIFYYRGYGISAGAHTAYNIIYFTFR